MNWAETANDMHKIFLTVSRVLMLLVMVGVLSGFLIGEAIWINSGRQLKSVKRSDSNGTNPVLATDTVVLGNGQQVQVEIKADDARPLIIRKYLEKYKSPLAPYSDLIFKLSEAYKFDYYWIVAIGQQESNLCKKIPDDSYNCWGYGIHKRGTLRFDNYELSLKSYAEYLKREYFDKGLNTPELMMKKYCPSSNGSWARGVRQFINEMESGDFI